MKALLDEQLSDEIAKLLRSRGLDVDAVTERDDLTERSDEDVFEVATAEGRAVVTNNIKDYRPIAAARVADGRGHAGLILIPSRRARTRAATGVLADAIAGLMLANEGGTANAEHWVPPLP